MSDKRTFNPTLSDVQADDYEIYRIVFSGEDLVSVVQRTDCEAISYNVYPGIAIAFDSEVVEMLPTLTHREQGRR